MLDSFSLRNFNRDFDRLQQKVIRLILYTFSLVHGLVIPCSTTMVRNLMWT